MTNKTEKTVRVTKAQRNEDIMLLLEGQPVKFGTTVEDAIAHLTHENELLAKKNTSGDGKKPTKAQEANSAIKAQIVEYLTTQTEGVTASVVMTACGLSSNQKAAALLNALAAEGRVIKAIVKGKSLFSVA